VGDRKKLTAKFVETVTAKGKYFDSSGLFLRVSETSSKKWVQRYTSSGIRREIGLGSAKIVTLSLARELALRNLLAIREGKDPLELRNIDSSIPSFEEASRSVHQDNIASWGNKKHAAQFISTLEAYAFPKIGNLKVNKINSSHILNVLSPIWLSKEETARRLRQRLSKVMSWCIAQRWRTDDPAGNTIKSALPRQSQKSKPRKSLSYNDVSEFIGGIKLSNASLTTKLGMRVPYPHCHTLWGAPKGRVDRNRG